MKNLAADLATQNAELAQALKIAASRFGFVVVGFSGRDESVTALFREAIDASNAFPHGFYWTGIKGMPVAPPVEELLIAARHIAKARVQAALESLRDRTPPMVWKSARGEYAIEDAAMHAWFKSRYDAEIWPPTDTVP